MVVLCILGSSSAWVNKSWELRVIANCSLVFCGNCIMMWGVPLNVSLLCVFFPTCYNFSLCVRVPAGVFAFGLFATDIFVNAGQVVTGGLSPYFLSVCKPNYTGTECRFNHQFIVNGNICTGNPIIVENARRSFPSKDASLSVYSAVYLTVRRSKHTYECQCLSLVSNSSSADASGVNAGWSNQQSQSVGIWRAENVTLR